MEIGTEVTRSEYRESHGVCLRPIYDKGLWRFCWQKTRTVHEIIGRRGVHKFSRENLCSLCEADKRNCHLAWAHREGNPEETEGEIRTQLFAVKYLIEEVSPEEAEQLMREGKRSWWREDLGRSATFAGEVAKTAAILMDGGLGKWIISWRTLQEGT